MRIGKLVGPGVLQKPEIDLLADERERETLRTAIRRELAVHGSLAGLAREIGVGRIVLRKFLALQAVPTPANLQLIREWAENRPPAFTPLAAVLLAALTRGLPGAERSRARGELAEALAASHQRAGDAIPEWLRSELGMMVSAVQDGPTPRARAGRRSRAKEG